MIFQEELRSSLMAHSERVAIEFNESKVTYEALAQKANAITQNLLNTGLNPAAQVAITLTNKVDIIAAIIGVIKARGVFVLLDPKMPSKRKTAILNDLSIEALIAGQAQEVPDELADVTRFDFEEISTQLPENSAIQAPEFDGEDSLYIYFTSGSTGQPKGIIGKNSSLLQFINWEIGEFELSGGPRVSQLISPYFDAFLRDVFVALLSGGTVCIPPDDEDTFSPEKLTRWIDQSKVNLIHCVPSVFRVFNDASILHSDLFADLQWVMMSGEKIIPPELKSWYDCFGDRIQLINLYGPTETTMIRTSYRIKLADAKAQRIPIGKPMDGTRILIANKDMKPCNKLVPGDLYIITDYMTKGYLARPELMKEKFVTIKDQEGNEVKAFKSGDKARMLANGQLDLLGREDRMIKLRGIRIELEEIENTIARNPSIKQCAVIVQETNEQEQQLIAFLIKDPLVNGLNPEQLLSGYLKELMPEYMIPAEFIALDQFPQLTNGKINYKELVNLIPQKTEIVLPVDERETRLLGLWKSILGDKLISTDETFQHAGGNSLNMIKLISLIYREFNVRVTLGQIFKHLTIQKQSLLIHEASEATQLVIEKTKTKSSYSLSTAQRPLYFLYEFDKDSMGYNMPEVVRLVGELDVARFKEAFRKLMMRHESLRTTFDIEDDLPVQKISTEPLFSMDIVEAEEDQVRDIVGEFIRPFDLSTGPLMKVGLIKTAPELHYLMVDIHHIIVDGASLGLLIKDFMDLYNEVELVPLKLQFKDFTEWQQTEEQKQEVERQRSYWLNEFAEPVTALDYPTDFPRPKNKSFKAGSSAFKLSKEETAALKQIADKQESTLFMVTFSIYNILLRNISGQEDIVIGTPVAGREHIDFENIVGMFVLTLPLRNNPAGNLSFIDFLQKVKAKTLTGFDNQSYPYSQLIQELDIERDRSRNPLFDVLFAYQNFDTQEFGIPGIEVESYSGTRTNGLFDLALSAFESDDQIFLHFGYSSAIFKPETIERFQNYYMAIVRAVIKHQEVLIKDITVTDQREQQLMLNTWNQTDQPIDLKSTFWELFEQQVKATPDRPAITHKSTTLTYQELSDKANQMAAHIAAQGQTEKGQAVTFLPRGIDMLVAMLGTFKAGWTYIPIDIDYPEKRVYNILSDSEAEIILTSDDLSEQAASFKAQIDTVKTIIKVDQLTGQEQLKAIDNRSSAEDLAYIIYTSGTSGKPKGAMIHHIGMVNHLYAKVEDLQLTENDVVAQTASAGFDISIWQFLVALLNGGKTLVIDQEQVMEPYLLMHQLKEEQVTVFESVPSLIATMLEEVEDQVELPSLRWMIATGEPLGISLTKKWYDSYPKIPLFNAYGPTEASDDITHHVVPKPKKGDVTIPIGKPVRNMRIYIVDAYMKLCPPGVTGEICVAGIGVGYGYWQNEAKTKAAFVANPFCDEAGFQTLYRTGDNGYFNQKGEVICLGRKDDQVKIRGYRIEVEEIASLLAGHPAIATAVVLPRGEATNKYLVAYYVAKEQIEEQELKDFLAENLPPYMVPRYYAFLTQLPTTSNGKLDHKKLPSPQLVAAEYIAPTTQTENELTDLWAAVLKTEGQISIEDNFFELGGHSLKAAILVRKIFRVFNVELSLQEFFTKPTIRQVADHIDTSRWLNKETAEKQVEKTEITI